MKKSVYSLLVIALVAAFAFISCGVTQQRPAKPTAQPGHVVIWENNQWVQITQEEADKREAEKVAKEKEVMDRAAMVENVSLLDLFANPANYYGKQVKFAVNSQIKFTKVGASYTGTLDIVGQGKKVSLKAFDGEYFSKTSVNNFKKKYGIDGLALTKADAEKWLATNVTNITALFDSNSVAKGSSTNLSTGATEEYESVKVILTAIE